MTIKLNISLPGIPLMADDPYLIPGTWTLKNKFNERNQLEASDLERRFSTIAFQRGVPEGRFDSDHLKVIHKHLFNPMYEWAGEFRTTPLQRFVMKGEGVEFAKPEKIKTRLNELSEQINNRLPTVKTQAEVAQFVTDVYSELNSIHPFREGNGRTAKAFSQKLSESLGYKLDLSKVQKQQWDKVSEHAFKGHVRPMQDIIFDASKKIEQGQDPLRIINAIALKEHGQKSLFSEKEALISRVSKIKNEAQVEYITDDGKKHKIEISNREGVIYNVSKTGRKSDVFNIQALPNVESWERIKTTLSPEKRQALVKVHKQHTKQNERSIKEPERER